MQDQILCWCVTFKNMMYNTTEAVFQPSPANIPRLGDLWKDINQACFRLGYCIWMMDTSSLKLTQLSEENQTYVVRDD